MTQALLPERRDQLDFFVCDILEADPKDDIGSMEHPMFSLSTKPDMAIRHYEHKGSSVTIAPGAYGLATIHDKDILIYCISQLTQAINDKRAVSKTVRMTVYDYLKATNRGTGGREYKLTEDGLKRLAGTQINTNIMTGGARIKEGFGLIDKWRIIERSPTDSRMTSIEITLSDWLFNAVVSHEVLTLHHDYFRLRKPLERRLYELARKHCGKQSKWAIGLDLLHKKSGSTGTLREFRRSVLKIIDRLQDKFPGYRLMYSQKTDKVTFYNCNTEGHKQQVADLIAQARSGDTPRF